MQERLEKQFREELASIRKKLNLITYDRYQNRGTATNLRGNLEKFSYSRDNIQYAFRDSWQRHQLKTPSDFIFTV